MACVGLLLRLGIYRIPSYSCWHYGGALASSISIQQVFLFFWCQNGLLVDRCYACWWVLSGWFSRHKVSLGSAKHRQYSASPWLVIPLWVFAPVCPRFTVPIISISCCQCWPCKDFRRLAFFVGYPRNGGAKVRCRSYRWKLGAGVIRGRIEDWALLGWYWSVNFANNKRFGHFQLETHLLHPGFSAETLTKHLKLYLLCPGGSRFENGIVKAPRPSGLFWSSNFLYPWSDKSCCGLWKQTPCACNLSNNDAMSWRFWQ